MKIDSIQAGWLIKEGKGAIGPVLGAERTVRFNHTNGKSVQWHFPTRKDAKRFTGIVLRIPTHIQRPADMEPL